MKKDTYLAPLHANLHFLFCTCDPWEEVHLRLEIGQVFVVVDESDEAL